MFLLKAFANKVMEIQHLSKFIIAGYVIAETLVALSSNIVAFQLFLPSRASKTIQASFVILRLEWLNNLDAC